MPHLAWLLLLLVWASVSQAARFVETKTYPYAVGTIPKGLDDSAALKWLESRPKPKLSRPPVKLDSALRAHFKLGPKESIQTAVLGAPRVTGSGTPKFYVWVVAGKGHEGAARLALVEERDDADVEVLDFVPKREVLKSPKALEKKFPVDALILMRAISK